jgi:excisionase family DNA binding protein
MTATEEQQTEQAERTYTTPQVAELTGATYRMIDHWTSRGFLPETATGSGSRRRFTEAELDTVRLVEQLLRVGFVLPRAFAIAEALVSDEEYRADFADVFQLSISVRDTAAAEPTTSQEPPA